MANQFFGFSAESFEQFVRALGMQIFGPGLTSFGDGPDGGREATFHGEVPYPFPPATRWHGYGVIQAKCKSKPETTEADRDWALKQLRAELIRFETSEKRSPKPEYYVFVTNVELSSAAGGGRDQAKALLESFAPRIGLKGSDVWDGNQLSNYVNSYHEIRRRFKTYLTVGDLLFALLEEAEQQRPDLVRIVTNFLERELRADESARLDQAGNRTDQQLQLARLFFDLPAASQPNSAPPTPDVDDQGRLRPGILAELLRSGSRKLDSSSLYELEIDSAEPKGRAVRARYILLGGPGSGKSTIGQFLAQIHRAALLARRPPHELEPASRQIIRETRALCEEERLAWPATPRYPFRVELSRFAKTVSVTRAEGVGGSLAAYLISQLQGADRIDHRDLLKVMRELPWLLILDGLDEVPSSSNRDAVVRAVDDFMASARSVGCDLFVVATSRERGYMREFASGNAAFRYVLPLSPERAISYVTRYARAKFGASDAKRAEDLVSQLRQSAGHALTAQLMSSPLQVTFMATVAAARGDPGKSRWQLFENYYRTIYERELQKAVPPYDGVLGRHQNLIDRLHHDVAFWLQYHSETQRASSSLPIATFECLVEKYLTEEGQEGSERRELVAVITEAARERLVFLVSRTEGELSFDVRSLQEYMAAECLMTGDADAVRARLLAIAPTQYWRNTLQFAVSRCFVAAGSRHLQESIRSLCVDLSETSDMTLSAAHVGAELALDILQDGSLAENLTYARHLCRVAFRLVDGLYFSHGWNESSSIGRRFLRAYRPELRAPFETELKLRSGQKDLDRTLAAWSVLGRFANEGIDWARNLAAENWPAATEHQYEALVSARDDGDVEAGTWLADMTIRTLPRLSQEQAMPLGWVPERSAIGGNVLAALGALRSVERSLTRLPLVVDGAYTEVGAYVTSIRLPSRTMQAYALLAQMRFESVKSWPAFCAAAFVLAPSRDTLADALELCAGDDSCEIPSRPLGRLPWPLAACLHAAASAGDLRKLARAARDGKLGDADDWDAAERRWEAGILPEDFLYRPSEALPFDASIASKGVAGIKFLPMYRDRPVSEGVLKALVLIANELPHGRMLTAVLAVLMQQLSSRSKAFIDPAQLRRLLEKSKFDDWTLIELHRNENPSPEVPDLEGDWLEFFDWFGREAPTLGVVDDFARRVSEPDMEFFPDKLEIAYLKDPSRLGLLRLLSRFAKFGLNTRRLPKQLGDLKSFDEPKFRFAAAVLVLSRLGETKYTVKAFAADLAELLELHAEPNDRRVLFELAESSIGAKDVQDVLVELYALSKDLGTSARIQQLLGGAVSMRPSAFQVRGPKAFGLPEIV